MTHDNADALNRLLDDLAYAAAAVDDDLDPDLVATVRWFRDLGAAPLPDPDFRTRLEHDLMNRIVFAPAAGLPASAPHPSPSERDRSRFSPPAYLPARLPHWRWASARVAAALLLVALGLTYLALGPLRPGPDRPHTIPAAVGPAATPGTPEATATAGTFSRVGHPFIGAWNWTLAEDPGCCGVATADVDGTYLIYNSAPGVGIGTWRATGERTVELSYTFQHVVPRDLFDPTQVALGTTFSPGMEVWRVTVTIDETGNTARLVGRLDALDSEGNVVFTADSIDWRGTRMVPDSTAVTPTPTT